MIDTICLLINDVQAIDLKKIEKHLCTKSEVDNLTNETLYSFSCGNLKASYDSSINIKINNDNSLRITCSPHKVLLGHNICYGSDNLKMYCNLLKKIIYLQTDVKLPSVEKWELLQIDYTLTYWLDNQKNVENYINSLKNCSYARRESKHFGNESLYIKGATTTIKFYNKQKEYINNDYKKIKKLYGVDQADKFLSYTQGMLRIEVSIRSRKLKKIFINTVYRKNAIKKYKELLQNHAVSDTIIQTYIDNTLNTNKVTVQDISINILQNLWAMEVEKVLKENEEILVNTDDLVYERLVKLHSKRKANALFAFWTHLSTRGEEYTKGISTESTYYRNLKEIKDSQIGWKDTNINLIENQNDIIVRFRPTLNNDRLLNFNRPDEEFYKRLHYILNIKKAS